MKLLTPNYYCNFNCIADQCNHSCCIGWEIDIDETTYRLYQQQKGDFGNRLRANISPKDTPHFQLGEGERCPFLNEKNLCDIILELGEGALCQICTDHPRFRNFYTNYIELGLGLCCEATGRLILGQKELFLVSQPEESLLSMAETEFFHIRNRIFSILQERSIPLFHRIQNLLAEFHLTFPKKSVSEWAKIFLSLEHLEEAWCNRLQALSQWEQAIPFNTMWELPFEQLICYFIYRHFSGGLEDGEYGARILFAVLSTVMVVTLSGIEQESQGSFSFENLVEIARLYSSEIEYSEENTRTLLGILSES